MGCCRHSHPDVHASTPGCSFRSEELANICAKWGIETTKLVMDALAAGFTKCAVLELLDRLGPVFLCQAIHARRLARNITELVKTLPKTEGKPSGLAGDHTVTTEELKTILDQLGPNGEKAVSGPFTTTKPAGGTDIFGRSSMPLGAGYESANQKQ